MRRMGQGLIRHMCDELSSAVKSLSSLLNIRGSKERNQFKVSVNRLYRELHNKRSSKKKIKLKTQKKRNAPSVETNSSSSPSDWKRHVLWSEVCFSVTHFCFVVLLSDWLSGRNTNIFPCHVDKANWNWKNKKGRRIRGGWRNENRFKQGLSRKSELNIKSGEFHLLTHPPSNAERPDQAAARPQNLDPNQTFKTRSVLMSPENTPSCSTNRPEIWI